MVKPAPISISIYQVISIYREDSLKSALKLFWGSGGRKNWNPHPGQNLPSILLLHPPNVLRSSSALPFYFHFFCLHCVCDLLFSPYSMPACAFFLAPKTFLVFKIASIRVVFPTTSPAPGWTPEMVDVREAIFYSTENCPFEIRNYLYNANCQQLCLDILKNFDIVLFLSPWHQDENKRYLNNITIYRFQKTIDRVKLNETIGTYFKCAVGLRSFWSSWFGKMGVQVQGAG